MQFCDFRWVIYDPIGIEELNSIANNNLAIALYNTRINNYMAERILGLQKRI